MATVLLPDEPATEIAKRLPLVLHTRVVTGGGGGPEKTILNSPRYLPALGYRSICAFMRPHTDEGFASIRRRAAEWSAPLVEIDDGGPFDLGIFRRFLTLCREHHVAIWHGHDYKSNLIGLWVQRYWPMKLVTTVHGWVVKTWKTPLYYAIDRQCLKWYDRVICVSDDLQGKCLRDGLRPERCLHIDNAIDTEQFRRTLEIPCAKERLGWNPNRLMIGAVGRLSAEKGFDILIRAIGDLVAGGVDVALTIVGDGDQRESLQKLVQSLGLQDRVQLLGFRADTIDLYQAFDVFALSSYREGLPNVVLEAMALKTPIVATTVGGVPKTLQHEVDGLLVEPGSVPSLCGALKQVCADSELRRRLAIAARATIESRFSFARRMEKVARVYDDALKLHGSQSVKIRTRDLPS